MLIASAKVSPYKFLIVFLLLHLCICADANAQFLGDVSGAAEKKEEVKIPEDSLGRRTPRGAVNGFFKAVADQNYIRASRYLKLKRSRQRNTERERVVKLLQRLLDQGGNIIPTNLLSDSPTGKADDDLAPDLDLVGTVAADGETINLYLENTGTAAEPLWQFSSETVEDIAVIKGTDELLLDRILPQQLKDRLLAGVPLGHWLAVIILIAFAYFVAWSLVSLIAFLIKVFWRKAKTEPTSGIIEALHLPFRLYFAVWLFVIFSQQVGISIIVRQRFSGFTLTIGIIAILILLWRLADFISNYIKNKMSRHGRVSAISVILFLRRTAKVALIVLGIITILSAVGVDITTWIAALGIGGIALALGTQKTVENFVGSVTLITDQPVRVGDYCKVGDITGTVEAIGMRSTKIRTGERTVVTIPNGDFSSSKIENYAHRDRFLFSPTLEFRMETTPDQMRYLLVELRALLYSHPMVNPDPAKVRFTGFGASSLKVEFWAYIEAPGFDQYQEAQEDILLRIMDIVAASGTDFAYPSQTLYLGRDKGVSEEKADEVAGKVRQWKEQNELQIPSFDIDRINEIKNTIPYPPEGSVQNKKKNEEKDPSRLPPEENKL